MTPKLLVVDDEPHILMLLEQSLEALEEAGVELLTATNGADALDLIRTERPRLVILDVMMPKMNGFDVCRAVKEDLSLSNTIVILLTAKGQEADRATGQTAGADHYLTKPFDPRQLRARCAELLDVEL